MTKHKNKTTREMVVPIFYACDDNFVKYTVVSIRSLLENASRDRHYKIHLLNAGLSAESKVLARTLCSANAEIIFVDVRSELARLSAALPLRDYYSNTTYYRFFIAKLFPQYKKVVYLDGDTVVLGDVAALYDTELGENYVGACHEEVTRQTDLFGRYVEQVLDIDRNEYFNAGVLVLNTHAFRKHKILDRFVRLVSVYSFTVAQDQDYLNVLCRGHVVWLPSAWNTQVYGTLSVAESQIKILHYIMVSKPWHYADCRLQEYFWRYASLTAAYPTIKRELDGYTDEERANDKAVCTRLAELAAAESERLDRYACLVKSPCPDRLRIAERIRILEREGRFDEDVEDDPKGGVLAPDEVDYLLEKRASRCKTRIANRLATRFYEREIRKGELIIERVEGLGHLKHVEGGCFLTCNHFSIYDNYALWRAVRGAFPKGKRLYKIIREGNYTGFSGLFGFFFRHCNTLPLSSHPKTMQKFLRAVDTLIARGESILIYPEQAMWWNYKKPRPLKKGAFQLAARTHCPVVPCFITQRRSGRVGRNGLDVPAYTVWICEPIYPKDELAPHENTEYLRAENFRVWKELYERVYGEPLRYGE